MKRVAFLTLADRTGYFVYDHLAVPPLRAMGIDVVEIPWDAGADWSAFDAVVIRSPWDYVERTSEFFAVLEAIDASTTLLNALALVRWNVDKRYLAELETAGVRIVPTRFGQGLVAADLASTSPLVVKPVVGANARDTFLIAPGDDIAPALRAFTARPFMLQPFVASIREEGEVSLFYFEGEYSHAVRKRPKAGDFRVQEEHGGLLQAVAPTAAERAAADAVLARLPSPFQARVDLVRLDDGAPAVMEVELIEPSLYFPYDDESPIRFARALRRRLDREVNVDATGRSR